MSNISYSSRLILQHGDFNAAAGGGVLYGEELKSNNFVAFITWQNIQGMHVKADLIYPALQTRRHQAQARAATFPFN